MVESGGPGGARAVSCQREAFSLPADRHYLNCAYLAPLARKVEDAGIAGIRRKADPSGVTAADFFADPDEARRLFARLIGAPDPRRVALVPAVSYGVATVVRNTPVARGQNIVLVGEDFPSDVYSWRRAAVSAGADLRVVAPPPGAERGERWNARLFEAIDRHTAAVAVPHVHWTDGTRFDLEAIGHACRSVGAAFIVDGTQSVGALPFDLERFQPDALICAGYKWLLGPYSTALAYYGSRYDDGEPIEESWIGRKNSEDFRRLVDYEDGYAPGAVRYDGGERSNFILLPMMIAALRLVEEWGPDRIQEYCRRLTRDALARARDSRLRPRRREVAVGASLRPAGAGWCRARSAASGAERPAGVGLAPRLGRPGLAPRLQ